MEYVSAIVDECGWSKYLCSELTGEEIDEILENHPEWRIEVVEA